MPNIKRMGKTMMKLKIAPEIMAQMDFNASTKGNNPHPTIAVIDKMDELLTDEQKLAVMEPEGCCKGGKRDADCKAFGKEHKDKPLRRTFPVPLSKRTWRQAAFEGNQFFTA